jgi:broad specificity phosphatase PhoE
VDLILVRHGVTDWNEQGRLMGRSEIELNARGHEQAHAVAETLRDLPVRAVVSSPQRRTQQTAAAIAAMHQLPVRTEDALAEVQLGRWQGMSWNDLRDDPEVTAYLADPTYVCDAFEPGVTVHQRVVSCIEALRAKSEDTMVVVSHGDPLRILLAHYLAMPLAAYRRMEVTPGSVSLVRFTAAFGVRVMLLNWRPQRDRDQLRALR